VSDQSDRILVSLPRKVAELLAKEIGNGVPFDDWKVQRAFLASLAAPDGIPDEMIQKLGYVRVLVAARDFVPNHQPT
jgi:hypothetical protein